MINLLKYYAKKRINVLVVLSAILILLMSVFVADRFIYINGLDQEIPRNNPLTFITVIACILCTIIPMFEFSFKMKKVGIDLYYSLPIKREKLYTVKYIVGLLETIIPLLVLCVGVYFKIITSEHIFNMGYYWLYTLCLMVAVIFVYSIVAFVFSRCNTIHDGIICVLGVIFVFTVLFQIVNEIIYLINFMNEEYNQIQPRLTVGNIKLINMINNSNIYSSISNMTSRMMAYMENDNYSSEKGELFSYIFIGVLGLASAFGTIICPKFDKSEKSMDISDSWFSYKIMLPIYIIIIGMTLDITLAAISAYIGYVIFRRTFKIKICDIITGGACIVFTIIFSILMGVI